MTTSPGTLVHQHATHAQLIGHGEAVLAESKYRPALDAIIVPASRPAHNLEHAITLARAARCRLVILCSRDAQPNEIHALLAARSFSSATVIEIPPDYGHAFFAFDTTTWIREKLPGSCAVRDFDLSMKRNVGLVLARMLGWQRIFFMDDDIRDLDAAALTAAVSLLASASPLPRRYYSVGVSAQEYPDNSVVCHARRAIGEYQDVFISGSALAVDCTVPFGFFPDVYNEDWLFFYQDAREGKLGSSGDTATQLRYDPFANPQRAAAEEFGDIIAEFLYALLEDNLDTEWENVDRWGQFLADRKRILNEIIDHADMALPDIREKMIEAVETARTCLTEIHPDMCVDYVKLWRRDLGQWEAILKKIRQAPCMHEALASLGLKPAAA